jgi:heterodisulfide reductase subunit C
MDLTPRQLVALFRAGFLEEVLRSRTIWLCASCYACTVRCPAGIRVTDNIYALKRLAKQKEIFPRRFPAYVLSAAFASNIHRYGRNWELWLAIRYFLTAAPRKLLSGHLMRTGIAMARKGRMGLRPRKIRGIEEIRAIVAKAEAIGGL